MEDNNSLGSTIRLLRKERHLTQEELAEGICSPVTVSRVETGRQMPTKAVLDGLLSRLGASTYQLCDVYYKNERDSEFARAAKRTRALLHRGRPDEARELLDSMDESSRERPSYRQLYLMLNASTLITIDGSELGRALDLLDQAIRLTKPTLRLDDFRHTLLSPTEAECIGLMVPTLCYLGRHADASRLGKELIESMDNQNNGTQDWADDKIGCELNLALSLEQEGRYAESLRYIERAHSEALDEGILTYMPVILYAEARVRYREGQRDEALGILRHIAPYMDLTGQHEHAAAVRNWVQENMSVRL